MRDNNDKWSRSRERLAVCLLRYNKLRSKTTSEIAVVEGDDDATFYSTIFARNDIQSPEIFFVANGKDNVLGLRELFSKSKEISRGDGVVFFVDRDFDDLKGYPPGPDIYITPTYSIENLMVSSEVLRRILHAEFSLGEAELIDDRDRILQLFQKLLDEHADKLHETNRLIHYVRKESSAGQTITSGSIDQSCEKFADVNPLTLEIVQRSSGEDLNKLIGIVREIKEMELSNRDAEFFKLDPRLDWRGKFLFYLFRRWISFLVEDRNTKQPKFFSVGKGKVSFDTKQASFIRVLASVCVVPECLANFISGMKEGKHLSKNQ